MRLFFAVVFLTFGALFTSGFLILEFLFGFVLQVISTIGYAGVFLLMAAESTVLPIPSEMVLPFAGYLVSLGDFGVIETIIAALAGSILGSLISYYLGKKIGRAAIIRFGEKLFLKEEHLNLAHEWFDKYGEKTIFVCRFIPAVRHVISIPAGVAEMNLKKFVAYTALGAFFWNMILIFAGMLLQKNWEIILEYSQIADIAIIAIAVALVAFFIFRLSTKKA